MSRFSRHRRIATKLLADPTNHAGLQFFRYGFVAIISLAFDTTTLYVLTTHLHVYYLISAAVGLFVGLVVNYVLSIWWVFTQQRLGSWRSEFGLFLIIGAVATVLNLVLIWLFTAKAHFYYLESKALATVIVYFWNFGARRYFVFGYLAGRLERRRAAAEPTG